MESAVRRPQVIRVPRPVAPPPMWKRIMGMLPALSLPKFAGVKAPAAVGASDSELRALAAHINAGPKDRGEQQDVFVVLYGGGIPK